MKRLLCWIEPVVSWIPDGTGSCSASSGDSAVWLWAAPDQTGRSFSLLPAASGPSAAEVRILLINSRLHQHQGSPCAPCCWGFISSRCNKLSQNSRLCDPEAVCSALLSGSVCCFPAWCSSAPHRILHLLPCERCCSHFLPLHLLLLLMLLCQLCWSVRCLSEL